jgi:hypothetical protein
MQCNVGLWRNAHGDLGFACEGITPSLTPRLTPCCIASRETTDRPALTDGGSCRLGFGCGGVNPETSSAGVGQA